MEYFSSKAFLLGALLFSILFLSNIIYSLFCYIYKIKMVEFGIFHNPWFSLYSKNIFGINFILGWLPFSSHIKPLGGMVDDEEERKKIKSEDLPYTFFNKPKYLRTIFYYVPWILYLLVLDISILIIYNSNVVSGISDLTKYFLKAFQTMFGDNSERTQFILMTKEIILGKSLLLFSFSVLMLLMLVLTSLTIINGWVLNLKLNKSKIPEYAGYLIYLLFFGFILWKLPKFVFSFFTLSQNLIYISSFIVGLFSVGVVFFFMILFVAKNILKNK